MDEQLEVGQSQRNSTQAMVIGGVGIHFTVVTSFSYARILVPSLPKALFRIHSLVANGRGILSNRMLHCNCTTPKT
jgi:hypothetical protein